MDLGAKAHAYLSASVHLGVDTCKVSDDVDNISCTCSKAPKGLNYEREKLNAFSTGHRAKPPHLACLTRVTRSKAFTDSSFNVGGC
jgi:hypothetical protein